MLVNLDSTQLPITSFAGLNLYVEVNQPCRRGRLEL
jgi:hypothetical protein